MLLGLKSIGNTHTTDITPYQEENGTRSAPLLVYYAPEHAPRPAPESRSGGGGMPSQAQFCMQYCGSGLNLLNSEGSAVSGCRNQYPKSGDVRIELDVFGHLRLEIKSEN